MGLLHWNCKSRPPPAPPQARDPPSQRAEAALSRSALSPFEAVFHPVVPGQWAEAGPDGTRSEDGEEEAELVGIVVSSESR